MMQGLMLAAGKGSRIEGVTENRPKSLLPFGETTLLGHTLAQFDKSGVERLVIVVGYQRQQIIDYVGKHWKREACFVFNPLFDRTNVLFSFWLALDHLHDETTLYIHADTVVSEPIVDALIDYPQGDVVLTFDSRRCEEEEMKVRLDGSRVTTVTKNMSSQEADGEFTGFARIGKGAFDVLRQHAEDAIESGHEQEYFEFIVQRVIDSNQLAVEACDITGKPWNEIDFEEDYTLAKDLFGK